MRRRRYHPRVKTLTVEKAAVRARAMGEHELYDWAETTIMAQHAQLDTFRRDHERASLDEVGKLAEQLVAITTELLARN